jgi:serine/threonine protein phosphatase PrpC
VESGLLDETEAMHHDERHLVSNTMGSPNMRIEIGPKLQLAPCDTLLLASDGLFDNLHVSEIVERIRTRSLEQVGRRLAEDCHRRMLGEGPDRPCHPDDLTFLAYRPGRAARSASAASGTLRVPRRRAC